MQAETMTKMVHQWIAARPSRDTAINSGFGVTAQCLVDPTEGEVAVQAIEFTQTGSLTCDYPAVSSTAGVILEVTINGTTTQIPFGQTLYFANGGDTLTVANSPGTQCQFYFRFDPS